MKKILGLVKNVALVIVVLAVIGAFLGNGSSSDSSSSSKSEKSATEQAASKEEQQEEEQPAEDAKEEKKEEKKVAEEDEGPSIATDAKYAVTINDSRIVEDYDGAPCIAIDFTFTNVSDKTPTSMQLATSITVYQSGVECEDAWFASDNSDGYTNKVKAGVSVDTTRVYKLQNLTDDVEVEVGQLFSWSDDLLAYEVYKLG